VLVRQDAVGLDVRRRSQAAGEAPKWEKVGTRIEADPSLFMWDAALAGDEPYVFAWDDDAFRFQVRDAGADATAKELTIPEGDGCRADFLRGLSGATTLQVGWTCHFYSSFVGTYRPGDGDWQVEQLPRPLILAQPLGTPAFAGGASVVAFVDLETRPATGEAGITWKGADGVWHAHTGFVPSGVDQLSRVEAAVDAAGYPMLLVAVGESGSNFLARPERLYLVRYHP
jgi:hypothetical protein